MRALFSASLIVGLFLTSACESSVSGEDGNGGAGGTGSVTGVTTGSGLPAAGALAYFGEMYPSGVSATSVGAGGADTTTLHVIVGTLFHDCEDAANIYAGCDKGPAWRVTGFVPQDQQVLGQETSLVQGLYAEQLDCSDSNNGFYGAKITLSAIDEESVSFTLSDSDPFTVLPGNADGSYVAPRCN